MSSVRIPLGSLHLNHDVAGMVKFLSAFSASWNYRSGVTLDLSDCTFLNAEGAAILAAFALHRGDQGFRTDVDWGTIRADIRRQLGRWRVSELYGQENSRWTDNAIPLLHQSELDARAAEEYISTVIRAGENMPAMTNELAKRTNVSLCELLSNVFEHAESRCGGLAIGQYYPKVGQVQICVCDMGVGLAERVQRAGHAPGCRGAAIHWALGEGNTTKAGLGGVGLFVLREFVKANGGSLRILANTGYYAQTQTTLTTQTLRVSFPGTLIQIGLKIRPDEFYTLEVNEDRF